MRPNPIIHSSPVSSGASHGHLLSVEFNNIWHAAPIGKNHLTPLETGLDARFLSARPHALPASGSSEAPPMRAPASECPVSFQTIDARFC